MFIIMLKGFTPEVAIILIALVTVGISVSTYYWISSLTAETQGETESAIQRQFEILGAKLKIDTISDCKIYIKNIGENDISFSDMDFYIADLDSDVFREIRFSPPTGTLKKYETTEINFINVAPGKYKLLAKVYGKSMDFGFMTCTSSIACFQDTDCDDNEPCTNDTCNNPGTPSASCSNTWPSCGDNDDCCPPPCDFTNDNNCPLPTAFSCTIRQNCAAGIETEIIALSDTTNARAELPTEGNYDYKLCCSNVSSVTYTSGTGTCALGFTGLITLATNSTFTLDTNAKVEEYNYTNPDGFDYKKNVCVQLDGGGSLDCFYTDLSTCSSLRWDKIISLSSSTNAFVGNDTSYPNLVLCCISS